MQTSSLMPDILRRAGVNPQYNVRDDKEKDEEATDD